MPVSSVGLEEHLISIKLFVSSKTRLEIRRGPLILRAQGVGDPPQSLPKATF